MERPHSQAGEAQLSTNFTEGLLGLSSCIGGTIEVRLRRVVVRLLFANHFKGSDVSLQADLRNDRGRKTPKNEIVQVMDEEDTIEVDIRPFLKLNYSMLHNQRSMFPYIFKFVLNYSYQLQSIIKVIT